MSVTQSASFSYPSPSFAAKVSEITGGKGVNVVLDCIAASYWERNVQSLAIDGRWVLYGTMGGSEIQSQVFFGTMLHKRIRLLPSTLKTRSDAYKAELVRSFSEHALSFFASGAYKPVVDSVFPLDRVVDAHRKMEANENKGKIILKLDSGSCF